MNKKLTLAVLGAVFVVALAAVLAVVVGPCTPDQAKPVAQNAGVLAAVGWIAIDNPTSNEVTAVESVLVVIESHAGDVEAGATYTEVVFPEVLKVIQSDVDPQYRPVCKAGCLALLGSIDTLFATHPEWKEDQTLTVEVVDAFILGAKMGLSMREDDPKMFEAKAKVAAEAKAAATEEVAEVVEETPVASE